MGTLGDRIGRRRLLLMGAAAFGLASVLAAFSTSAEHADRAPAPCWASPGATLAPSTLSLIRNMFLDPRQRTAAIGVWATSFSVGGAMGPLLGGAMLQQFWWGAVFLLAVPVMVLLLVLGPSLLPEYRDPAAGRLDLTSAALSLVAVLAGIYGLKAWARDGLGLVPLAVASCWRLAVGCAVPAPAAAPGRSADRPAAVPRAGLPRVAGHLHAHHPGGVRLLRLHRPVPAAGARAVAAGGRAVDVARVAGGDRRLDAGAGHRAAGAPGLRDGRRPGAWRPSASPCSTQVGSRRPGRPGDRLGHWSTWAWARCSRWAPTSSSARRRPSGRAPRPPSPRPARSSAARWASPCWAASAPPSTAAMSRARHRLAAIRPSPRRRPGDAGRRGRRGRAAARAGGATPGGRRPRGVHARPADHGRALRGGRGGHRDPGRGGPAPDSHRCSQRGARRRGPAPGRRVEGGRVEARPARGVYPGGGAGGWAAGGEAGLKPCHRGESLNLPILRRKCAARSLARLAGPQAARRRERASEGRRVSHRREDAIADTSVEVHGGRAGSSGNGGSRFSERAAIGPAKASSCGLPRRWSCRAREQRPKLDAAVCAEQILNRSDRRGGERKWGPDSCAGRRSGERPSGEGRGSGGGRVEIFEPRGHRAVESANGGSRFVRGPRGPASGQAGGAGGVVAAERDLESAISRCGGGAEWGRGSYAGGRERPSGRGVGVVAAERDLESS